MILLEYQNIKTILQKAMYQIDLKKCSLLQRLIKNIVPWTYAISDLKGKEIAEIFYGKEMQKTNQNECKNEKVTREKAKNYLLNGKDTIIRSKAK